MCGLGSREINVAGRASLILARDLCKDDNLMVDGHKQINAQNMKYLFLRLHNLLLRSAIQ